jgi:hypothetical protein
MLSLSGYIEDVYELIKRGCCPETLAMTHEFNYKLLLVLDKYLNYSFFKLRDLPAMTKLRIKLEFFIIENFDQFNILTKGKNRIKEHSGFLFENLIDFDLQPLY